MIRRASRLREKRVHYARPRDFSPTRKRAEIAMLGEEAMKTVDSAAKLAFEKNANEWKIGKSPPDIPITAVKQLSRALVKIYGEMKLGYGPGQMEVVWRKIRKGKSAGIRTTKSKGELQNILKVISKIESLASSQTQRGGIMEEYGRAIMMNSPGTEVEWADRHGISRHMENYSVPKKELLRLVRFAAYEAAVALNEARNRVIQQMTFLKTRKSH